MSRRRTIGIAAGATLASLLCIAALHLAAKLAKGEAESPVAAAPAKPAADIHLVDDPGVVHVQVQHAQFHIDALAVLRVDRMEGRMIVRSGSIISLDDLRSFTLQLDSGVTRLNARDLSSLLNSYLLRNADSAIEHVAVHFEGQKLVMTGEVHKLVSLPFEGIGTLSATRQGDLRLHLEEFKVAGILNRSFLSFFGIHVDRIVQPKHQPTFRAEADDLIAPISSLFPPPLVSGKLTEVRVEGQDLVQIIGHQEPQQAAVLPAALPRPLAGAVPNSDSPQGQTRTNFIYFRGGRMRFGKLTMDNVDLKLLDKNNDAIFDFSLQHYQDQIRGGYTVLTPTLGLVAYAQDYDKLAHKGGHGTRQE